MQRDGSVSPSEPDLTVPSGLPSALLTRVALAAIASIMIVAAARFAGLVGSFSTNTVADFQVFHLVGQLVWQGRLSEAYYAATMMPLERQISGDNIFLPWTYPPPFDLMVAPFALMPVWLAYLVFMGTSLTLYLVLLHRLAGQYFGVTILAMFPTICMTINCGQNGFLTGSLVCLACLGLLAGSERRASWSGLPLGLMVIKPHLAVGLALYTLGTRRWRIATIAIAVILASVALSTLAFGPSIWTAFLNGVAESKVFLERGYYPLHRMISSYALARTLGAPAHLAMLVQAVAALLALATVCFAISRAVPARQALGLAAMTTLLVSPYAYDYDLPIYGVGLALVMPDLLRLSTRLERIAIGGLCWLTSSWGIAMTLYLERLYGEEGGPIDAMALSLGGVALIALTVLTIRVLSRGWVRVRRERSDPLDAGAMA